MGELDAARASFARALDLNGRHPAGPEGLARVALAEGEAAAAADVLEIFLLRHPDRGHARFLLGTAYRMLGRLDEARVQLELSEGSSPAAADPWLEETEAYLAGYHGVMQRAVELGAAGEAAQIAESLTMLRREYPDDVTSLEKLVAAQLQLGRPDDAIAELDNFLERTPEHSRAWFLRALVLEAKGDLQAAEVAIAHSIGAQGDWVPSHELAARVSWRRNDLVQAVESLERALHLGGAKLNTMLKLARALQLLGDPGKARDVLHAASDAFPLSAESIQAALQGLPEFTGDVGDG
jgi:tetratricopeptide (TPR) repeat protein